ncbi:ferredoxin [Streptomyces pseudovenezuelae]|uniref:Ferredoxin n=1 Tax=Streptomyces pseudovenezuelae TaxID=67350 RepID=A0ABT6M2H9_9ACTN|nr:ferredoxin [Streptomyces pseudovenezuelae]MDH6222757.1 ferredoxin [Streptomyces pseudovenezuelae]
MHTDTRVEINRDVCIGAGQCALVAPDVFTQDDGGLSTLLPGHEDGGGAPMVREAVRACPVSAITVSEA